LNDLDLKENEWKRYLEEKEKMEETKNSNSKNKENGHLYNDIPEEFTEEDIEKRKELISQGFPKWTKKDFSRFIKACEYYGYCDY